MIPLFSKIWWIWNIEKKGLISKYHYVIKKEKIRNTRSCHHRNDDEKLQQLSLHHLLLIGLAKERAILPQSSQKESCGWKIPYLIIHLKGICCCVQGFLISKLVHVPFCRKCVRLESQNEVRWNINNRTTFHSSVDQKPITHDNKWGIKLHLINQGSLLIIYFSETVDQNQVLVRNI